MTKITKFCKKNHACQGGRKWAQSLGIETMEELWKRTDIKPEWRMWIATRLGVLTARELRLFACFYVRQNWHLLTDERCRNAVEVAERYANGEATEPEISAAYTTARDAAYTTACHVYYVAALAADYNTTACDAAYTTALAAAYTNDSHESKHCAQSEWLLKNTNPIFGVIND